MSRQPTFGWSHGRPVHARTVDHLPAGNRVQRANRWLAIRITRIVGSMWCAYAFALFDLISLPSAIHVGTSAVVSWVAQTFLQLVLLSVIMVGQNVQAEASDARAAKTFEDTEQLLDLMNTGTQGGLADVMHLLQGIERKLEASGK